MDFELAIEFKIYLMNRYLNDQYELFSQIKNKKRKITIESYNEIMAHKKVKTIKH